MLSTRKAFLKVDCPTLCLVISPPRTLAGELTVWMAGDPAPQMNIRDDFGGIEFYWYADPEHLARLTTEYALNMDHQPRVVPLAGLAPDG